MDVDARLESLLRSARWVRDPATAHALVPSIAAASPPLVALADQRPDDEPVVPVLDAQALIDPLLDLFAEIGATMVAGTVPAAVESLSDEALRADPLVGLLRDQILRGSAGGLGRGAVPALTLAWASGRLLQGEDLGGLTIEPARQRALSELRGWLVRQDAPAQGAAISTLTWELSGRMSAALQLARQSDPLHGTDPLSRALLSRPALLGVSRRAWTATPDFALLGALMGIDTDPGPLQWVQPALRAAVQASEARKAKGKAIGADAALAEARRATGDPADVERLAYHPVQAAFALGALPDLVSVKELKAAGVPAEPGRLMTKRPGALALAAAWGDLLRPLLEWDLLSALLDRVVPVWHDVSGAVVSSRGPIRGGARLALLAPRPKEETEPCAIVAIRLTELQSSLRGALGAPCPGAAASAFAAVAHDQHVPAHAIVADHGVAAFRDAQTAMVFALAARAALAGPRAAQVAGVEVSLTADASVSVGLARGVVVGGSDGVHASLGGPAVGEAVALTGSGPSALIPADDPLGIRRAGLSAAGFSNGGMVASGSFLADALDALRRKRAAVHVQGEAGAAAGLAQDFQLYPALAWWEQGAGRVVLALAFADPPGAGPAAELMVMGFDELRELHRSDGEAAAIAHRVAAAPPPAAGAHSATIDPFADDLGPDVGQLQSEAGASAAAAPTVPEPTPLEAVDSVFGFAAEPSDPAPAEPPAAPTAAHGAPFAFEEESTGDDPPPGGQPAPVDDGFAGAFGGGFSQDDGDDFEARSADDELDDELGKGLLDAFSREGGAGEPPALPSFDSRDVEPPRVGTLALYEDDGDDPLDGADLDRGPEVGRLTMIVDDDAGTFDTGPTVAAGPDLPTSAAPVVDIEDDWDDDDSWDSDDAEEGVLSDDFDDGDGASAFGFEPTLDDPSGGPFSPDDADTFAFAAPDDTPSDSAPADDDPFSFAPVHDGPETDTADPPDAHLDDDSADAAFAFVEEPDDGPLHFPRGNASPDPEGPSGDFSFSFEPVESEPVSQPASAPDAATPTADDDPLLGELVRMFQNYKVVEQAGVFTFGIRDGDRMRDALRFDTAGDAVRAYQEFLQYKIRHGFVTEAHKVADLPPGVQMASIDGQLLRRAYVEVAH